jgi:hypothetical protein
MVRQAQLILLLFLLQAVVPDVPLIYFISTILAHRDVFRKIKM